MDSGNQDTNSQITVFDMRLRDIENELQAINLNYEYISFEINDMKTIFKNHISRTKQIDDVEEVMLEMMKSDMVNKETIDKLTLENKTLEERIEKLEKLLKILE